MTPDTLTKLTALRRELHMYPELSGQEQNTAARMADLLSKAGADRVMTQLGGHGVAAVFDSGKPGPTVAIRCELDGLPIEDLGQSDYTSRVPGKGHLCGHDGHMVMVLAVAQSLGQRRSAKGKVALVFQPAEETGQGAIAYRNDPRFAEIAPDYIFALHNLPGLDLGRIELCKGPTNCASRGMRITLTGKTSHAAAPQDGISPAKAVSSLMPLLADLGAGGDLNAEFALTTVTHANLGQPTFGVSPGQAEIWVTLRTVSDTRMQQLVTEAEHIVNRTAAEHSLQVYIAYDDVFEACVNDSEAVSALVCGFEDQGVHFELTSLPQKFSEDFGQFGKSAKAAMLWLGAGRDHPQLHNPDYDFPDELIPVGSGVFLSTIRHLLG